MNEAVTLTPEQMEFLIGCIPGFSEGAWSAEIAATAGSDRRFVRIRQTGSSRSFILVIWNSEDADWGRFIAIQSNLGQDVPFLPVLHAWDENRGYILEEDLGDMTLCRFCMQTGSIREILGVYRRVLDALVVWQNVDPESCPVITSRSMDRDMFLWESDYFSRHCITELLGLDYLLTPGWEKERTEIALITASLPVVPIHRDFQSENVLIHSGRIGFVDYQGARLGPAGYDLASLLYDPYVTVLDESLVADLFAYYRSRCGREIRDEDLRLCAMQRLMQALGAYANLSINKGKTRYRRFVPLALTRLESVVDRSRYPHLSGILTASLEHLGRNPL